MGFDIIAQVPPAVPGNRRFVPPSSSTRLSWAGRTVLAVMMFFFSAFAEAAGPTFTLDVSAAADQKEISLTVPPGGIVPITLIRRTPIQPGETMDLHLSEFVGEAGGSVKISLLLPDEPNLPGQPSHQNIPIKKSMIPIQLAVPKLPTAGKYTGRLILSPQEGGPFVWAITLTRAKAQSPAELVVDRQAVSLLLRKSTFPKPGEEDGAFTVMLREKKGEWPLENIAVSLEQVTKAPEGGFDFNNIDFFLGERRLSLSPFPRDSASESKKTRAPEETSLTIPAGGHANIGVKLHDLRPGEYHATLRFRAANSVDGNAQKLALTMKVREPWLWPTVILLVGILISFTATKGLSMVRQRSALQKRISELNLAWLRNEPPISPAVWARATLRQAEDLSASLWLSSPALIESRLAQVEQMLSILDRTRQIRTRIEGLPGNLSPFIIRRAQHALSQAVYLLGAGPIDDKTKLLIEEKLAKLGDWLDPKKLDQCYGEHLKEAIDLLVESISAEEIDRMKAKTKQEIGRLLKKLKEYKLTLPREGKVEVEKEYYSRLKILWERHEYDDFDTLVEESKRLSVQALFKKVDGAAWKALKAAGEKSKLVINVPERSGPDPLETYESLNFSLSAGDPLIEQTYLFKHGLEYHWTFALKRNGGTRGMIGKAEVRLGSLFKGAKEKVPNLTPRSVEPRVMQYAPWPAELTPSVAIVYKGKETVKVSYQGDALIIARSKVFGWTGGFQFAEIFSIVISVILGVGTGLVASYIGSETFGSLKDYFTLFIWGAGVDQTRNALQILQTYTAPAKPASP
jgi:hypothetical protein